MTFIIKSKISKYILSSFFIYFKLISSLLLPKEFQFLECAHLVNEFESDRIIYCEPRLERFKSTVNLTACFAISWR